VLFEKELKLAFFGSEGFDERVYRNAYNQIERVTYQSSSTSIDNIPVIDLTTQEETNQQLRIDNTAVGLNYERIDNEGK
jgi:hypothetical protein